MNKIILLLLVLASCSSFEAKRVSAEESDKEGLRVTDNWMSKDTSLAVKSIIEQIYSSPRFKRYLATNPEPRVFIAEVQNESSEPYFPIGDFNSEMLFEISRQDNIVLVDNKARDAILKEITYQNDGMVDASTSKQIGRQLGADLLIFGNIYMKPEKRDGKKVKEYSVNIRLTDLEKGTEVLRARKKVFKVSDRNSYSW